MGSKPQTTFDGTIFTTFKGKGNANAVFGGTLSGGGHDHGDLDDLDHLVVRSRLRARPSARDPRLAGLEARMWSRRGVTQDLGNIDDAHIQYAETVVAPLLGTQYLARARRVALDPPLRLLGDDITFVDSGVIMADGTLLAKRLKERVVCIEIKPKFGGLVHCATVHGRHSHLKKSTSRYQLHQVLKLQQGAIDRVSAYDPLDLFSGDPERMQAALEALMDVPQNNLALFLGGDRVDPVGQTGIEAACAVLGRDTSSHLAATVRDVLVHEGVLDKLLQMQTLCEYDVHAVELLCRGLIGDSDDYEHSDDYKHSDQSDDGTTYDCTAMNAFLDRVAGDESRRLDVLADYCIAATAKDCSILVAMTLDSGNSPTKQGTSPRQLGIVGDIAYRVTVVDLDIKPLEKLAAHKRLDLDILRANNANDDINSGR